MHMNLPDKNPTLSQIALAISNGGDRKNCTRQDVVDAAKARDINVRNGRIFRGYVASIFFETRVSDI